MGPSVSDVDLIVLFKDFQPCGGVNHDRLLSWLEESLKEPTLKGRMTLRIFSWYEGDEDSDDEFKGDLCSFCDYNNSDHGKVALHEISEHPAELAAYFRQHLKKKTPAYLQLVRSAMQKATDQLNIYLACHRDRGCAANITGPLGK